MSDPTQRRGMTRQEAADYCGCETIAAFDAWVRKGIVPGPIPGTHRWDRRALDAALDRASGIQPALPSSNLDDEYEAFKRHEGQIAGR